MEPIITEHTICSACGEEWFTMHNCEFKILCPACGHMTESTWSIENDVYYAMEMGHL